MDSGKRLLSAYIPSVATIATTFNNITMRLIRGHLLRKGRMSGPAVSRNTSNMAGFGGGGKGQAVHLLFTENPRNCMKKGGWAVIRYSSTHEKDIPNRSFRCRMDIHRTSHPRP
jgi:hypothetical protein